MDIPTLSSAPEEPTEEPTEELALPDFEEGLWAHLRSEHRGGVVPIAARRHRSSHRSRRLAAAAAVAAALVVAGAAVATVGDGNGARSEARSGITTDPGGRPDEGPTISLEARIIAAIDDEVAAGSIVMVEWESDFDAGRDSKSWTDEVTGAHRDLDLDEAGDPAYDSGLVAAPAPEDPSPREPGDEPDPAELFDPAAAPHLEGRVVDHCLGQYVEEPAPVYPRSAAGAIRDGLADGTKVLDGTETIDGRELIRIRTMIVPNTHDGTSTVPLGPGPHATEVPSVDESSLTYVDPQTYRPVMARGHIGSEVAYTMRFSFLDRTPTNLASLVAPVPAGFDLVAAFPDGESPEAVACR